MREKESVLFCYNFVFVFNGWVTGVNGKNHRAKCQILNYRQTIRKWAKPQLGKVYFPLKKMK